MGGEMTGFSKIVGEVVCRNNQKRYLCMYMSGYFVLIKVLGSLGRVDGFEVWKLRTYPQGQNLRYMNKWGVKFPCNEDFGTYGWSFQTLKVATQFFGSKLKGCKDE